MKIPAAIILGAALLVAGLDAPAQQQKRGFAADEKKSQKKAAKKANSDRGFAAEEKKQKRKK